MSSLFFCCSSCLICLIPALAIAQSQQVALWTPPSISTFRNVDFQCFIIQSFFSSGDFARSIPSHPFWYSCSGPPGTYGTVYRARDTETGDIVALKKAISSAAKIGRKKGSPDTDNFYDIVYVCTNMCRICILCTHNIRRITYSSYTHNIHIISIYHVFSLSTIMHSRLCIMYMATDQVLRQFSPL